MNINYVSKDIVWKDCYPKEGQKYKLQVEKLLETDPDSRAVSNMGGYQSIDDLNARPEYEHLVDLIEMQATQIHQELELVDHVKFSVINMWANINWKGDSNSFHSHVNPPSQNRISSTPIISGVFYCNVPPESGRIGFVSNRLDYQKIGLEPPKVQIPEIFLKNIDNYFLNNIHHIEPEEGDMYLFFSDLMHGVESSRAKDNHRRISISFNLGLELVSGNN